MTGGSDRFTIGTYPGPVAVGQDRCGAPAEQRTLMDTNRRPTLDSPFTAFLLGLSPVFLTILAVAATTPAGIYLVIELLAGASFIFFVVRGVNRRNDPRHAK